jgi:hypothetical protein
MGTGWSGLDLIIWLARTLDGLVHQIFGQPSRTWAKLARDLNLGLWYDAQTGYDLAGQVGEFYLRVTENRESGWTEVRAESRDIPRDFLLRRKGFFEEGRDIPIGDESFDEAAHVRGDEAVIFALLTRENRKTLLDFVRNGGVIDSGVVCLPVRGRYSYRNTRLAIRDVFNAARHISLPRVDIPQRLADNAAGHYKLYFRLRSLELLQEVFGSEEIARKASVEALADRRSAIRFRAAVFLRDFEMLAKISSIESEPVDIRIQAMKFLIGNAPPSNFLPLLWKLLDSLAPDVRMVAIGGLGELRHRPALEKLCRLVESADMETAIALAIALGKVGDSAAEPTLLDLLDREHDELKIAAAEALGHAGTTAAVEPLLELTRGFLNSELKKAAREAIARIQSRLGDVEAGRLTLSELPGKAGALSFPAEGGELSLSNEEGRTQGGGSDDNEKGS